MPRGAAAEVGDRFTNKNGYIYEKTEDRGFVGLHVLLMEAKLGRQLQPGEFVKFRNGKHEEEDYNIDNLELRARGDRKSPQARLAIVLSQIEELEAERDELQKLIDGE